MASSYALRYIANWYVLQPVLSHTTSVTPSLWQFGFLSFTPSVPVPHHIYMRPPRMDTAQLSLAREPFDRPDFLFELKHDGFRALAHDSFKAKATAATQGRPCLKKEDYQLAESAIGINSRVSG